jgi:transcriptional regulator with XRE-family HTH domain
MTGREEWDPRLHELGSFIRLQRQMADLSLRQLADLTQVSNAYLSQIERGLHSPSLRVIRSIADALNLSAEALLAQAGMAEASTQTSPPTDTETAIANDPDLTPESRAVVLGVYRSLRQPAQN